MRKTLITLAAGTMLLSSAAWAEDPRELVTMPPQQQQDMLIAMRDHLIVLDTLLSHVASERYREAAALAEQRLGLSPFDPEIAVRLTAVMPPAMLEANEAMRDGTKRFAAAAKRADSERSYTALRTLNAAISDITASCNGCHAHYPIR